MNQHALYNWHMWNEEGLIPGPLETEKDFIARVAFCHQIDKQLIHHMGKNFPLAEAEKVFPDIYQEVFLQTDRLYGIRPHWVPLFFSNHQLAIWHGGCAWIFQLDSQTPTSAFLQLRAHFSHSQTYLGIYHRSEIIAHELAHVGRMMFQEPQFEEFFAYQTSSSIWRRYFGPIIQSSKESLLLILTLVFVIFMDILVFLTPLHSSLQIINHGSKLLLLILTLIAFIRLYYRHYLLNRCLKNLIKIYPPIKANHLLYRLSDDEIKRFAYLSPSKIKDFILQNMHHSFRWRFLYTLYPFS